MSEYVAVVRWMRNGAVFTDNRYSRAHEWEFDGGVRVPASSSPHVVPVPLSNASHVDPEEAFVAALSSCHMLWFLSFAAQEGFTVDRYVDHAVGVMETNAEGKLAMTRVILRPQIHYFGENVPDAAAVEVMHHLAHETCFLANSVKTVITVEKAALPFLDSTPV